jgi:TPR repeat protein
MTLLKKAAGQGHAYAMDKVADIHDTRKEHEQALAWFAKGAEAGLPRAMFSLGAGAYTRPLSSSTCALFLG